MGKYLEIAQRALEQIPQDNTQDDCTTEDQLLTAESMDSVESPHCEKRELSEISPCELKNLAGDDWEEIRNNPAQLEAMRHMVKTAKQIEAGQVPKHFTNVTNCRFCGPVYVYPGFPPETQNCPWCRNRHSGLPIPEMK